MGGTQTTANTYYGRGTTPNLRPRGPIAPNANIGSSSFGIQPGGGDWAPGTLTLRAQNNTGVTITDVDVAYELWVRNDQGRSRRCYCYH
ncbi:MAG: hypothetical protein IPO17_09645 [Flavobacteriales bacterium]|nr:hypothetical protein [Flavobacteriales bacterium]